MKQVQEFMSRYSPWSYAAVVILVVLLILGLGDRNGVALALIGYLVWWVVQTLGVTFGAVRAGWDMGNMSSMPLMVAWVLSRQAPVYAVVLLLLLVDAIAGTKLGANIFTFIAQWAVSVYLVRRASVMRPAGDVLRRGRVATAQGAAVSNASGKSDRYAKVRDVPAPEVEPVQRLEEPQKQTSRYDRIRQQAQQDGNE